MLLEKGDILQGIEIFTIILAVGIVVLPIVLKIINKKKGNCTHKCDGCGKECPFKNIKDKIEI